MARSVSIEKLSALLSYDPQTGHFTRRITTSSNAKTGDIAGTLHKLGYWIISIDGYDFKAHRLAWLYVTGEWPSGDIDHANGIRSDNRFCNLRIATHRQNMANAPRRVDSKHGKGVKQIRNRWQARIGKNGIIHLGTFNTKGEALAAYAGAARAIYGKFSRVE